MPRIRLGEAEVQAREDETVLDALVRGGVNVDFSCKKGSCHTCMLRATEGTPSQHSQRGLHPELVASGHFLPCSCSGAEVGDLELAPPDKSQSFVETLVAETEPLGPGIVALRLEPPGELAWQPGQYVNLRRPGSGSDRADGGGADDSGPLIRSYSVASLADEDYFVELHVGRVDDGQMSPWLCDEIAAGEMVELQGPLGSCHYDPASAEKPLLLIATGTGVSPLLGVARDALRQGHTAPIHVVHGARTRAQLYAQDTLVALAAAHPNLHVTGCLSREDFAETPAGEANREGDDAGDRVTLQQGYVTDAAFPLREGGLASTVDRAGAVVMLCGNPNMVYEARRRAVLSGVRRADIHADPFEFAHTFQPDDKAKIDSIAADPELWAAIGENEGLRAILETFYAAVYEDERLAPFFHNVTKQRAIDKQYEFLVDLFTGTRTYFGMRPFNAHHWMIIPDDLFDFREALFESTLRQHGLAEPWIRRWSAYHETFRREIVKTVARGMVIDGVEHMHEGYQNEVVAIGTLCDGCGAAIEAGEQVRLHSRTGQLYCTNCAATPRPQPGEQPA